MILNHQVLAIGNAYEMLYGDAEDYSSLSQAERADDRHFGQKSAWWEMGDTYPTVVVCTTAPSRELLNALGRSDATTFVLPRRQTSSICIDLMRDANAQAALTAALDKAFSVFIAPYIWTREAVLLSHFLESRGFRLANRPPEATIVEQLCDKVFVNESVFRAVPELARFRPWTDTAQSEHELIRSLKRLHCQGIPQAAIKSARAAGGIGTFVVESGQSLAVADIFRARGDNPVMKQPPFLLEEYVQWDISPTVDLVITQSGEISVRHVGIQRLYDDRYYMGFYSSCSMRFSWWYPAVCEIAQSVSRRVHELGYFGSINVDFVVSFAQDRVTLIELNPRRSALLDGYGIALMHPDHDLQSVSAVDYVDVAPHFASLDEVLETCRSVELPGALVRIVADGGFSSARWLSIWTAGSASLDSELVLSRVIALLQDPQRNEVGSVRRGVSEPQWQSSARRDVVSA